MKIAILGAKGFVGTHLTEYIRSNYPEAEVTPLSKNDFDTGNPESWHSLPEDTEYVIHCAAKSAGDTYEVYRANALEATALARFLNDRGVSVLVFYSTGGVYKRDSKSKSPSSEIMPEGDYPVSKWLAENAFRDHFKGRLQIARLYFPYGSGQSLPRLMPRLVTNLKEGKTFTCNPDGGPHLNFTHIEDICRASIEHLVLAEDAPQVVNIASPHILPLKVICKKLANALGIDAKFELTGDQPDTISAPWPDDMDFRVFDPQDVIQEAKTKDAA